jgi:hypothetical protein
MRSIFCVRLKSGASFFNERCVRTCVWRITDFPRISNSPVAPQNLVGTNGDSESGPDGLRRQPTTLITFAFSSLEANILSDGHIPPEGSPRDEVLKSDRLEYAPLVAKGAICSSSPLKRPLALRN